MALVGKKKKALVVVQCFPPLLKNAGGVSKRYFTLCRALIDGLGWQVTIMTPVNIRTSKEPDIHRWLRDGSLEHLPARGVRVNSSTDGVAVFMDLFSYVNAALLLKDICCTRGYDCVFVDDVPWRLELLLLTRSMGIPTVVTTHTDITHMKAYKGVVKMVWQIHMLSTRFATLHASVSRVFATQMSKTYNVPVQVVWPPILWAPEFRSHPDQWTELAHAQRQLWLEMFRGQGCEPKAIMLFAGRWSAEKRIHMLFDAVPKDCGLVIVGDGTSAYCKTIMDAGPASGRKNVLPLRKMLGGKDLRTAYAACDLFISASNFETLGNTVIEALCSGTPCALQPAQGHLEFVNDCRNSWFVNFEDEHESKATLSRIVAGGLDADSLKRVLPDFFAVGEGFRTSDFASDFETGVINKAIEVARPQRGAVGWIGEILTRVSAFLTCVVLFIFLRTFTRFAFIFSLEPEFEVLGHLGGADDDRQGHAIWTFPCVRLLSRIFFCERGPAGETPSKSVGQGDDYESHFRPARKKMSSVLEVYSAGVSGPVGAQSISFVAADERSSQSS